jgi:tRNA-splicing ligase RtcB
MIEKYHGRVSKFTNLEVNIHHNYATIENHFDKNVWTHRKGATSAKEGEYGIIPGSQGTASYITIGKGNRDSFYLIL